MGTKPCLKLWLLSCFLDNVHFQQAAEISEALVEQQVDFETMVSNPENSKWNHCLWFV